MRLERSKQWWLARAQKEGDSCVGAGLLAVDPLPEDVPESSAPAEDVRIAFGKFISLMRRRRGLSVEELAEKASLEVSELVVIEDDVRHVPEPRTVYQLAQVFNVSQHRLMQLAGLAQVKDAGLHEEAVRFAARSEPMQKLTREESAALEAFVAILSEQKAK